MSSVDIYNALIPLEAIRPHERNYRQHPDAQLVQLEKSHARFSQYRSVVLWSRPDGSYTTVAGHGIIEAMRRRGVKDIRADILLQQTPQTEIDAILIADNTLAQNASDDAEMLTRLLQEQSDAGFDLAALGSDEETLRQMLEALGDEYLGQEEGDGGDEYDTTPEEEQTRVQVGDIWQLGKHRIGALNSLDPEQVKRLVGQERISFVFSDPPYGIDIVATNGYVGGGEAYDIPFGGVKNRGDV